MLWQDLRYALRMMRRNGAFTAVAVLSLALGIGANTAIFSLIDTLMLRPLPVRSPNELVEPLNRYPTDPWLNNFGPESWQYMRDRNASLAGLILSAQYRTTLAGESVDAEIVDGSYFAMLGLKPAAGRLMVPEDDRRASDAVAVVSWPYWKSRFGLDPATVGRRVSIEDMPATIVGVAPKGFSGIVSEYRAQVWIARAVAIRQKIRAGSVGLIGRLKPGVPIGLARAELALLFRQSIDEATLRRDPNWGRVTFDLVPASAGLSRDVPPWGRVRDLYARPLAILMAVAGLLLAIACTNVASLLLARGAARQREMAVRVSLGAGRSRLLRQVLTESALLSVTGGVCGVAVAYFGAQALARIMASGRIHLDIEVQADYRMLLFTAGAALFTGLLFGLAPALRAMGAAPVSSLRTTGAPGDTRFGRLFGKGMVVAQVVIAVVLLSAAGLFLGHLSDLRNLNLGFQRDHILLASLSPVRSGYSGERLSNAYRELLDRLNAAPGIRSATLSSGTPISGGAASRFANAEGYTPKAVERRVYVRWIAPRFFETYGTPLVAGRDFTFQDRGSEHAAIVNRAMAHYYFGEANPLGRHVTLERDDRPFEIVGVVGDAKYVDLHEPAPRTIYLCAFQEGSVNSHDFAVRTSGDPAAAAGEVRRAVAAVLTGVPADIRTLAAQMDSTIVPERLLAALSSLFGALGALLAAMGLYGLLAYTVARRTNEIGIRMALGANRGNVTRMVLVDALGMAGAGLALGVPLAFGARRFAASLITGLPGSIAVPLAVGAAAMMAVALLAAYLPARRAAQVDPMVALRYE